MIERHHPEPHERAELTEQDLAVATLVGRYVERREAGRPPCAHDLLAVAAEVGDTAVDALSRRGSRPGSRWRSRAVLPPDEHGAAGHRQRW